MSATDLIKSRVMLYFRGKPEKFLQAVSLNKNTYYRRMKHPEEITMGELRRMKIVLHLTDDEVLRIVKGRDCSPNDRGSRNASEEDCDLRSRVLAAAKTITDYFMDEEKNYEQKNECE